MLVNTLTLASVVSLAIASAPHALIAAGANIGPDGQLDLSSISQGSLNINNILKRSNGEITLDALTAAGLNVGPDGQIDLASLSQGSLDVNNLLKRSDGLSLDLLVAAGLDINRLDANTLAILNLDVGSVLGNNGGSPLGNDGLLLVGSLLKRSDELTLDALVLAGLDTNRLDVNVLADLKLNLDSILGGNNGSPLGGNNGLPLVGSLLGGNNGSPLKSLLKRSDGLTLDALVLAGLDTNKLDANVVSLLNLNGGSLLGNNGGSLLKRSDGLTLDALVLAGLDTNRLDVNVLADLKLNLDSILGGNNGSPLGGNNGLPLVGSLLGGNNGSPLGSLLKRSDGLTLDALVLAGLDTNKLDANLVALLNLNGGSLLGNNGGSLLKRSDGLTLDALVKAGLRLDQLDLTSITQGSLDSNNLNSLL